MPQRERYDARHADRLYSAWHRTDRLMRYLPPATAKECALIDIDQTHTTSGLLAETVWMETLDDTYDPIALIETVMHGVPKPYTALQKLGRLAGLPAFVVWITATPGDDDIAAFDVKQIAPDDLEVEAKTPAEYAQLLSWLRFHAQRRRP